jgi:progesterone-induced-blocking factor 1
MSDLRVNYRVRSEELERLRIDYEDGRNDLRACKAENEMLKEKMSVLRSEFFKAEAKSKDD